MPVVRKLAPEEVRGWEDKGKSQRKLAEEQYDAFLAGYEVGDYGEAELDDTENRLTVRSRFKAAARRGGLTLDFKRTTGNIIRFKVISGNGGASEAEDTSSATSDESLKAVSVGAPPAIEEAPVQKKRGGRPRKTA